MHLILDSRHCPKFPLSVLQLLFGPVEALSLVWLRSVQDTDALFVMEMLLMLLLISNIQRFRDGRQISEAGMPMHLPAAGPHCPLHFLKSLCCTISNIFSTERQKSCTIYDVQGAIQSHKLHFLTPFYYIYMDIIYFTTFLSLSGGYIGYGAAE